MIWFNLECAFQTFGQECNSKCHCKEGGCNIVDGVCVTAGCSAGYNGPSCVTGLFKKIETFMYNMINISSGDM